MQTHTDTRSPLTRESTARIIRSDAPAKPNARLPQATMPRAADRPAKYRHEYKYEISLFDFFSLTRTLRAIMQPDPHADQDGQYLITSLYFDNCFDKALREKRDGLNQREKFRLRYYGSAPEKVLLEKKQKHAGLCLKNAAPLTLAECKLLLTGQRAAAAGGTGVQSADTAAASAYRRALQPRAVHLRARKRPRHL